MEKTEPWYHIRGSYIFLPAVVCIQHIIYLQWVNIREDDCCEWEEVGIAEHILVHCRLMEDKTHEDREVFRNAAMQQMRQDNLLLVTLNNLTFKLSKIEQER